MWKEYIKYGVCKDGIHRSDQNSCTTKGKVCIRYASIAGVYFILYIQDNVQSDINNDIKNWAATAANKGEITFLVSPYGTEETETSIFVLLLQQLNLQKYLLMVFHLLVQDL